MSSDKGEGHPRPTDPPARPTFDELLEEADNLKPEQEVDGGRSEKRGAW